MTDLSPAARRVADARMAMTDNHPITPPPELRRLWAQEAQRMDPHDPVAWMQHVSAQAARWGADQELEACCGWLKAKEWIHPEFSDELRAARRPKPPSLKERALQAWAAVEAGTDDQTAMAVIRRALEQLDD